MTTTDWLVVAGLIVGSLLLGAIVSRVVYRLLSAEGRPTTLASAASPISSTVFWGFVVAGLLGALGVIQPDTLDQMSADIVDFVPRVIAAAVLVIAARVIAEFVKSTVGPTMGRMPTHVQRQVLNAIDFVILGVGVLLAVNQLGIDTTIVNIAVAAFLFSLALSFALLVGLGGRGVASEVAAGRAVKRIVKIGDEIEVGGASGVITAMHPTLVELADADGRVEMIAPSTLLSGGLRIQRHD